MFFVLCLIVSLAAAGANPMNDEEIQPTHQLENVLKTENFAQTCDFVSCHTKCRMQGDHIGACRDGFTCVCRQCWDLKSKCNECCDGLCKSIGRRGGSCDRGGRCECQW